METGVGSGGVHHGAFGQFCDLPDSGPSTVMRGDTASSLVPCVDCDNSWKEPSTGPALHQPSKMLFTAPQPPSPATTPYGQYSATSLHVYQKENGMELPGEAT